MAKLIPLADAASILGMKTDELSELRSNNEVFGYRDGSSWKFKLGELERLAADRGIKLKLTPEIKNLAKESDIDLSAFEVSESASDIGIGESSSELIESDSVDLIQDDSSSSAFGSSLMGDDALVLEESADDLRLEDSGDLVLGSGEAGQADNDALSFGESDLSLASGSSKKLTGSDTGDLLDDEEAAGDSPSDTGKMAGAKSDDDMLLSEDDLFADDLLVNDEASFEDSAELSSDFEDSDMIMDDSDSSTEIELNAIDSDMGLSASESGISIDDEPLELGGSDIDSLELPEDDDMIVLDAPGDPDSATIMQEDDFNLTPLEADPDEESSGSQVIALEDSEIYADESTPTILGSSDAYEAGPQMLEDAGGFGGAETAVGPGGAVAMTGGGVPEAPYSVYQIVSLGAVLFLLLAGGAVAYDVARNMWQPADSVISSSVLNFFLTMTGMDKFS